jgi:hypothetical protein
MRLSLKLIIAAIWVAGIPASFILLHQKNTNQGIETVLEETKIPSYEEHEVEKCFFWIEEGEDKIYEKK